MSEKGPRDALDRAADDLAEGRHEAALQRALAMAKSEVAAPGPLFFAAEAAAHLGGDRAAIAGFHAAALRALDAGALALAVAACSELRRVGGDPSAILDRMADLYAEGSSSLLEHSAPPTFPAAGAGPDPLVAAGAALLAEAESTLGVARDAADHLHKARKTKLLVAPQLLFSSLAAPTLRALFDLFAVAFVKTGATLIDEGSAGEEAFVVARGALEVRRSTGTESVALAELGPGALFGEMALLSRAPRAASVAATRTSVVLVATQTELGALTSKQPEVGQEIAAFCHKRMVQNLMRTSPILGAVSPDERAPLIEHFSTRTFEAGEHLIVRGADAEGMHLVASGRVRVVHEEDGTALTIATLGVGDAVGEVALVLRRPANADVIADYPTVTMHLPRERFLDVAKKHPTLLAHLYELAVKRDEETASIARQEAASADDFVIV